MSDTRQPEEEQGLVGTAYHEAGHAVLAWRHGRNLQRASIVPDSEEETLGHVLWDTPNSFRQRLDSIEWHDPGDLRMRQQVEERIIEYFAGDIAEEKKIGIRDLVGAERDHHNALNLATYMTGSIEQTELFLAWLGERARAEVDRWWVAIEAVAEELLRQRVLSGERVFAIIADVTGGLSASLPSVQDTSAGEYLRIWRGDIEMSMGLLSGAIGHLRNRDSLDMDEVRSDIEWALELLGYAEPIPPETGTKREEQG
ncbi:MAG: hypothetical protein M3Q29_01085 [Chloroflexota bacterium]|nr:hypothetical protein [Chloroflexota bacterium]